MDGTQSDLTLKLQGLLIHIEQLGAEFRDPETPRARREIIRDELAQWYDACTKIMAQHHAD